MKKSKPVITLKIQDQQLYNHIKSTKNQQISNKQTHIANPNQSHSHEKLQKNFNQPRQNKQLQQNQSAAKLSFENYIQHKNISPSKQIIHLSQSPSRKIKPQINDGYNRQVKPRKSINQNNFIRISNSKDKNRTTISNSYKSIYPNYSNLSEHFNNKTFLNTSKSKEKPLNQYSVQNLKKNLYNYNKNKNLSPSQDDATLLLKTLKEKLNKKSITPSSNQKKQIQINLPCSTTNKQSLINKNSSQFLQSPQNTQFQINKQIYNNSSSNNSKQQQQQLNKKLSKDQLKSKIIQSFINKSGQINHNLNTSVQNQHIDNQPININQKLQEYHLQRQAQSEERIPINKQNSQNKLHNINSQYISINKNDSVGNNDFFTQQNFHQKNEEQETHIEHLFNEFNKKMNKQYLSFSASHIKKGSINNSLNNQEGSISQRYPELQIQNFLEEFYTLLQELKQIQKTRTFTLIQDCLQQQMNKFIQQIQIKELKFEQKNSEQEIHEKEMQVLQKQLNIQDREKEQLKEKIQFLEEQITELKQQQTKYNLQQQQQQQQQIQQQKQQQQLYNGIEVNNKNFEILINENQKLKNMARQQNKALQQCREKEEKLLKLLYAAHQQGVDLEQIYNDFNAQNSESSQNDLSAQYSSNVSVDINQFQVESQQENNEDNTQRNNNNIKINLNNNEQNSQSKNNSYYDQNKLQSQNNDEYYNYKNQQQQQQFVTQQSYQGSDSSVIIKHEMCDEQQQENLQKAFQNQNDTQAEQQHPQQNNYLKKSYKNNQDNLKQNTQQQQRQKNQKSETQKNNENNDFQFEFEDVSEQQFQQQFKNQYYEQTEYQESDFEIQAQQQKYKQNQIQQQSQNQNKNQSNFVQYDNNVSNQSYQSDLQDDPIPIKNTVFLKKHENEKAQLQKLNIPLNMDYNQLQNEQYDQKNVKNTMEQIQGQQNQNQTSNQVYQKNKNFQQNQYQISDQNKDLKISHQQQQKQQQNPQLIHSSSKQNLNLKLDFSNLDPNHADHGFHQEVLAKFDEFSESWRQDLLKEKNITPEMLNYYKQQEKQHIQQQVENIKNQNQLQELNQKQINIEIQGVNNQQKQIKRKNSY